MIVLVVLRVVSLQNYGTNQGEYKPQLVFVELSGLKGFSVNTRQITEGHAHSSRDQSLFQRLSRWDSQSSVYLSSGPDRLPGVLNVDDDGNGVVDDLSELGATGTDDQILTPADGDAYTVAASSPSSRVVSHGAMLPIWSSDSPQSLQQVIQQIPVPAELRIDAIDEQGKLHSRFISLR